ncbi:hypothetical protein [Massilia sp. CCM 8734]|uniref:hypothetical protein n=1 Tax=Massilia sp. CCM 8734 TaxID=2609283 RepID=UPI00141E1DBA|nr:hypothetical protein [Massilia sp. CCM 8734]NIA00677.1 hypothetical protein [Massilia sp. CCM 8734]
MTTFTIKRIPGTSGPAPKPRGKTIAAAINSVYGDDARDWEINFCNIPISLCMTCIADIYADMVKIEEKIRIGEKFQVSFLSSQITCLFTIEPRGKYISVNSRWTSASDNEFLQELQDLPQPSEFCLNEFLFELTKFLQSVKDDLISAGYSRLYDENHPWGTKQY